MSDTPPDRCTSTRAFDALLTVLIRESRSLAHTYPSDMKATVGSRVTAMLGSRVVGAHQRPAASLLLALVGVVAVADQNKVGESLIVRGFGLGGGVAHDP